MTIASLFEPIQSDLSQVEARLREIHQVPFPWLSEILSYVFGHSGKRIRPALTLLAGRLYGYEGDLLVPMATAVEVLHTASLLHDDTIDGAVTRRGYPTLNTLWNGGTAVLVGDYLFANAAELVSTTGNVRVMRLFAQTLMSMAMGELSQVSAAFNWRQTRQDYLERIGRKTAALFSMATESGALLSHAPQAAALVLKGYGYNLGIAYQIVDDILDFTATEGELGKPVGGDLLQGTLTLPALLLMERFPHEHWVQKLFEEREPSTYLPPIIERARDSSLLQEAYRTAQEFSLRAQDALSSLPNHAARHALGELATYVIERRS